MENVVVGLDLHLKSTQGTIMKVNGEVLRQEKFKTGKRTLGGFLMVFLKGVGLLWSLWVSVGLG